MFAQCFAVDEFGGYVSQVGYFAGFVDGENVWLVERRRDFRFLTKALHASFISDDVGRQDLQGDDAIEPRISREVNLAHTACAEMIED